MCVCEENREKKKEGKGEGEMGGQMGREMLRGGGKTSHTIYNDVFV